ncbi:putative divalent cation-dependent regulator A [Chlamydia psittaci 06-1683]|nr:putative divalent cation-dependent regulator A [Chlamydia psittaci 06-1683]
MESFLPDLILQSFIFLKKMKPPCFFPSLLQGFPFLKEISLL